MVFREIGRKCSLSCSSSLLFELFKMMYVRPDTVRLFSHSLLKVELFLKLETISAHMHAHTKDGLRKVYGRKNGCRFKVFL